MKTRMKSQKNNSTTSSVRSRVTSAVTMLLVGIIAMSALSYAWFQNHIDILGTGIKAGKMLYDFEGYHLEPLNSESSVVQDFRYTTSEGDNGSDTDTIIDLESVRAATGISSVTPIDSYNVGQSLFLVKKLDKSIDFDARISFSFNGLVVNLNEREEQAIDYTNSIWVNVYDESVNFRSYMSGESATMEGYLDQYPLNEEQSSYIEGRTELLTSLDGKSFSREMTDDSNYMLIRVVYGWNADVMAQMQTNFEMPIKVNLNVLQNGIDGDDGTGSQTIRSVSTPEELRKALDEYLPRDQIHIIESFTYTGDITIARPVDIHLYKDLTIQGNLSYFYMDDKATFKINVAGGSLTIKSLDGRVGGNFVVDMPDSSLKIQGLSTSEEGKADLYVENEFRVCTNTEVKKDKDDENKVNTEIGLLLNSCRICEYGSDDLKTITLAGDARIYVASRTAVGPIVATRKCKWIKIANLGSIDSLDLSEMERNILLSSSEPAIEIDSRGNWIEDETILLPGWSMVFYEEKDSEGKTIAYRGNTQIVFNFGSGNMKAYVKGCEVGVRGYGIVNGTGTDAKLFFDDYELLESNPELNIREGDIKRQERYNFVERPYKHIVDGIEVADTTKIIVHYEQPNPKIFANPDYNFQFGFGDTLESIISHYINNGEISELAQIRYIKIICYGDKVLTNADYEYIRGMSSLEEIDLSEAISANAKLPKGALEGITSLTKATMSEYDTEWDPDILKGTKVEELWLPASLKKLNNTISQTSDGKVTYNEYDVIGGIKIIHTSSTEIIGFDEPELGTTSKNYEDAIFYDDNTDAIYGVKQYFFVYNEATLEKYRAKYTNKTSGPNIAWNRCLFLEGESGTLQIFGDYVLRNLDNKNKTCEFVTYIGDGAFDAVAAAQSEYAFDFKTITIKTAGENGQLETAQYRITSYDDYAFCNRIKDETEIRFGNVLTKLGSFSFATAQIPSSSVNTSSSKTEVGYSNKNMITSVVFDENGTSVKIADYVFFNVQALKNVDAKTVVSAGAGCFWQCTSLEMADLRNLTEVTGNRLFMGCSSLERVDIGIIEKTDANQSDGNFFRFISGNSKVITAVHSYGQTVSFTGALAEDIGRIFVQDAYVDLYSAYITRVAELGTHTMDTILRADKNGNVLPSDAPADDVYYYFFPKLDQNGEETTEAVLSVYMKTDLINGSGNDVELQGKFFDKTNNKTYVVTRIGRAAYRLTPMGNINTLKIPDGVTSIGYGAFASDSATKYCVTFDLNNTQIAEAEAFYKMGAVKLYGNKLVEVGPKSISDMTSLVVACLPKLDRLTGVSTGASYAAINTVFHGCSKLHVAYVGPSTRIRYCKSGTNDYSDAPDKLTMFFVDGAGNSNAVYDKTNFIYMHMFLANSDVSLYAGSSNKYKVNDAGPDFNNIVLGSWYNLQGSVGTVATGGIVSYSITLPGYVFIKTSSTTLKHCATADEIGLIPGVEDYRIKYATPSVLYDTEETITLYDSDHTDSIPGQKIAKYLATDDMGDHPVYTVTSLGGDALSFVTFNTSYFKFGSYLKQYSYAPRSATFSNITTLDMSNIETISASLSSFVGASKLITNKVKTISKDQLGSFTKLKQVYLPSLVSITSPYPFWNCSGIETAILGENATTFTNSNPFGKCGNLKKLVFLSKNVVKLPAAKDGAYWGTTSAESKMEVVVHASLLSDSNPNDNIKYDTYSDGKVTYVGKYGNIPISNFTTFEEIYPDDSGVSYYWEQLSGGDARITSVVGEIPEDLVIPSVIPLKDSNGNILSYFNVVSVDKSVFSTASGLKSVTLPSGMKYLDFSPSDLPESLETLTVDASNTKFVTINGILYAKGGDGDLIEILIVPRSNSSCGAIFDLPSTVTRIGDEAFYGVKYIYRINIAAPVTIGNRAFANSVNIVNVTFNSETPSSFVGRDSFLGANTSLFIYVPNGCVDEYKACVWFDNFIRIKYENGEKVFEDMFQEIHEHTLNDFGYCTDAECPDPDEMIQEWVFDGNTSSVTFDSSNTGACYKITATKATTLTIVQASIYTPDSPVFMNAFFRATKDTVNWTELSLANGTSATITLAANETLYFIVSAPGFYHTLTITKS